jgi:hypothetical protein
VVVRIKPELERLADYLGIGSLSLHLLYAPRATEAETTTQQDHNLVLQPHRLLQPLKHLVFFIDG